MRFGLHNWGPLWHRHNAVADTAIFIGSCGSSSCLLGVVILDDVGCTPDVCSFCSYGCDVWFLRWLDWTSCNNWCWCNCSFSKWNWLLSHFLISHRKILLISRCCYLSRIFQTFENLSTHIIHYGRLSHLFFRLSFGLLLSHLWFWLICKRAFTRFSFNSSFLRLWFVQDYIGPNTLWFKGDTVYWIHVNWRLWHWWSSHDVIIHTFPTELSCFVKELGLCLVMWNACFLNSYLWPGDSLRIGFSIELMGKSLKIHISCRIFRCNICIKSVSKVFETYKDLVLAQWIHLISHGSFHTTISSCTFCQFCCTIVSQLVQGELDFDFGIVISFGCELDQWLDPWAELVFRRWCQISSLVVLESIILHQWILNGQLLFSLDRRVILEVEDLHPVSCGDLDANTITVGLVQCLNSTFVIILSKTSMLHQLDWSFAIQISRSSLGPIIHDSDLKVRSIDISHGNGWVNWIVVRTNRWICDFKLVLITFVDVSFNHLEAVWICPELTLWVKSIIKLPIHDDIFTLVVFLNRDLVELNFEFYHFLEIFRWKPNFDNTLLLFLTFGVHLFIQ